MNAQWLADTSREDIHADHILILDFDSRITQLNARRVREARAYSEIRAFSPNPDTGAGR